jgi:hypothetical protein
LKSIGEQPLKHPPLEVEIAVRAFGFREHVIALRNGPTRNSGKLVIADIV